ARRLSGESKASAKSLPVGSDSVISSPCLTGTAWSFAHRFRERFHLTINGSRMQPGGVYAGSIGSRSAEARPCPKRPVFDATRGSCCGAIGPNVLRLRANHG